MNADEIIVVGIVAVSVVVVPVWHALRAAFARYEFEDVLRARG